MSDAYNIVWSDSATDSFSQYLRFAIGALEHLGIELPKVPNDAIELAKGHLNGLVTEQSLIQAADQWWDLIEASDGLSDFKSQEMLEARVSLCLLLSRSHDKEFLSETINWFIQFLIGMGAEKDVAYKYLRDNFHFSV